MKSRFNLAVAGALCLVEAHERDLYPPKPVFLIVPFATGGQVNFTGRSAGKSPDAGGQHIPDAAGQHIVNKERLMPGL